MHANAVGEIVVHASCQEQGILAPCSGLWTGSPGNLALLALNGEPAPGAGGLTFSAYNFYLTSFDDSGNTWFRGALTTPDGDHFGIWQGRPGSVTPVALPGDPAPGTAGLSFAEIYFALANGGGTHVLAAVAGDWLDGAGYWKGDSAGLSLIARVGDEAPGTGGRVFGNLLMGASDFLPCCGEPTDEPLIPDISGPVLNQSGQVVFNGYLRPLDPATTGEEGIWIQDDLGLSLLALAGDPAPGTNGLQFTDFNHLNFNNLGEIAFDAALDSADPATDHGIWRGPAGGLSLVVREGEPAPGTAGETFKYLTFGPSMNNAGDIIFQAILAESGATGIWVARASGAIELVVRDGDSVKVRDGDYRTIRSVSIGDGMPSSMEPFNRVNEAGQLAISATFTDGNSGLFLATPIAASPNQLPVANAGPDQTVTDYQVVTLDGSASFDPEGTILSFAWSFDGIPAGSGPALSLGPLPAGMHTVTLTVTDRSGAGASDDMILTVTPNQPPVASAGPDQTVTYIDTVTFDGSGSADAEGGPLAYSWSIGGIEFATGPTPTAGPFVTGTFTVTLTVTDSGGSSATDTMILTVLNLPPIANAGPARTVQTLETVALDGTGSFDPEGAPISYVWTLDGNPIATGATPVVGPFGAGTHTITLTVTDEHGASASDSLVLTVLNRAPTASAGPDATANHAQTVSLDGSGSTDPEGGALSYAWTVDGVQVAAGSAPVVGPFAVGSYTIVLTVTDDHGATATDSMTLTVINEAPVADAGSDQTVGVKGRTTTVTLDGSASSDPEGGVLSYVWTLDGQSVGTGAVIQTNVPAGTHVFTLTVTDDHGATASDTVVVTAVKGNV